MKPKNTRFTIIMVVFVIVFIVMPYVNKNKMARPGATKGTIERLTEWTNDNRQTPEEYMDGVLRSQDITFIGEVGKFHEITAFVASLIPDLREQGVDVLAMSYLNWTDQEDIERLVTGESFDEALANRLLFNGLIMNGYKEYQDILRAVWEVNSQLPEGEAPLLLMGLNVEKNWSVLQTSKDTQDPEKIHQVYKNGVPDTFMAQIIKDEIIGKDRKALVFAEMQNTLSTIQIEEYQEKMIENGLPNDTQRMAWHIKQMPGVSSATILVHAPWSVEKSQYGIDYPVGGALDSFMEEYEMMDQRMGFSTRDTPFGKLPSAPGTFNTKGSHYLSDFCDGYILLGPIGAYTPFTAIPSFINTENFDRAVENFPGPKEVMPQSPRELNEYIAGSAANITQILEKFKK